MTKEELRKEISDRYINPTREYERKIQRFDDLYDRATRIAEYIYKVKTNQTLEEIRADLMREFYSFKGSILKSFRNLKTRTFEENVERAKQLRVKHRLKDFLNKWGHDEFTYDGDTHTIQNWVKMYLDGKIDSEKLFEIIKAYQDLNPDYDPSVYKGRNHDSSQAILRDNFA